MSLAEIALPLPLPAAQAKPTSASLRRDDALTPSFEQTLDQAAQKPEPALAGQAQDQQASPDASAEPSVESADDSASPEASDPSDASHDAVQDDAGTPDTPDASDSSDTSDVSADEQLTEAEAGAQSLAGELVIPLAAQVSASAAQDAAGPAGDSRAAEAGGTKSALDQSIASASAGAVHAGAQQASSEADPAEPTGPVAVVKEVSAAAAQGQSLAQQQQSQQQPQDQSSSSSQQEQSSAIASESKGLPTAKADAANVSNTQAPAPSSAPGNAAPVVFAPEIATPAGAQPTSLTPTVSEGALDTSTPSDSVNTARIARGLASVIQQNGGAVTLRLTPVELGTVRIQLHIQGGAVNAQFQASSESARQVLTQQLTQLRSALENQGLAVDRLSVQSPSPSSSSSSSSFQSQQQADASPGDGRSRGEYASRQGQSQDETSDSQNQGAEDDPRSLFERLFSSDEPTPAQGVAS